MRNPLATLTLSDGGVIQMELDPQAAPHAVRSFIDLAQKGVYDNQRIERIVPGWVLDMSYHAFHNPQACYFIPNDVKSGQYLEAVFGTVGMGGYGDGIPEISGGEFFFPLADCPAITGKYPIFGKVIEGLQELRRLEQLETVPVTYPGYPQVKINTPVEPVAIVKVSVETFGVEYGEPVRVEGTKKPYFWPALQSAKDGE